MNGSLETGQLGIENTVFRTEIITFSDLAGRKKYFIIHNIVVPELIPRRQDHHPPAIQMPCLMGFKSIQARGKKDLLRTGFVQVKHQCIPFLFAVMGRTTSEQRHNRYNKEP